MKPPKDSLLFPPHQEAFLTKICGAIGSFTLFFIGADTNSPEIDALLERYLPAPERFYDGDATVRDARKFLLAQAKGVVALLEDIK